MPDNYVVPPVGTCDFSIWPHERRVECIRWKEVITPAAAAEADRACFEYESLVREDPR